MNIIELFARIGLKTDEGKLKSFQTRMGAAKTGMIALTAAAAGTSAAIIKITSDATKAAVSLKQFEAETGASAQELQKWQSVAEQTNQSAQSVDNAIKAIVANQEKIKLGQGNISGFQLLGIDPREDPFQILEQLREKTDGLTEGMTKNLLQQLGVGTGLIQTLKLSRDQFDAMAGRAFIISPGAIESLNLLKSSMDQSRRALGYIKAQIAVGLAPQITALTKKFQALIKENETGIVKGFQEAFSVLRYFTAAILNTASVINRMVRNTIGWENAIKGVMVAIGLLNASLLASPIGLFTAAVILLVAVLDDLAVYSRGGKSLFGQFVEQMPVLGEVFEKTFGFLVELMELVKGFATGDDLAIDHVLDQWGKFGDIVQKIKEGIEYISGAEFKAMREEAREARGGTLSGYERMMGIKGGDTSNSLNVTVNGNENPDALINRLEAWWQSKINGASAQRGRDE